MRPANKAAHLLKSQAAENLHQSISHVASKLMARYGENLKGNKLDGLMDEIRKCLSTDLVKIANSSSIGDINICLFRIAATDHGTEEDHASKVSVKQLLGLVWLAIHDDDLRRGGLEETKKSFWQALYEIEIQDEYKLSENDTVEEQLTSGDVGEVFSKLLTVVQGVHPDADSHTVMDSNKSPVKRNFNQEQYNQFGKDHEQIKLDSTMYLAYRDLKSTLIKHLPQQDKKPSIRFLDYGCGPGTSTQIVLNILQELGYSVEAYGVDINSENLALARERLPEVHFDLISKDCILSATFDLVICNFVLIENKHDELFKVLENIHSSLDPNGVAIITNTTAKTYHTDKQWYSLNNAFPENAFAAGTKKLSENQEVKLELSDKTTGATFQLSDFFHSGNSYRQAYKKCGLHLVETLKPIGSEHDQVKWKPESPELKFPPYKIHVLYKNKRQLHCISGDGNVLGIMEEGLIDEKIIKNDTIVQLNIEKRKKLTKAQRFEFLEKFYQTISVDYLIAFLDFSGDFSEEEKVACIKSYVEKNENPGIPIYGIALIIVYIASPERIEFSEELLSRFRNLCISWEILSEIKQDGGDRIVPVPLNTPIDPNCRDTDPMDLELASFFGVSECIHRIETCSGTEIESPAEKFIDEIEKESDETENTVSKALFGQQAFFSTHKENPKKSDCEKIVMNNNNYVEDNELIFRK